MGANGSTQSGGSNQSTGGPLDHYQVLGLSRTATSIEIKKSFRTLALREHPDKNPQDVQGANERFGRIQEAYEVLSDEQERAWYDDHLEQILNRGGEGNDGEPTTTEADMDFFNQLRKKGGPKREEAKPTQGRRPDKGLQTPHLMKFFSTSSWSGYDDTPTGFYTTFQTLFSLLQMDEISWSSPHLYPSFGTSTSPSTLEDLRIFYSSWLNFSTEKDFSWRDSYRVEEGMPRYMRRDIEKENSRLRQMGKREYNETVRNLVLFVRRRDPRYTSTQSSAAQAQVQLEIKASLVAASKQRALERELAAKEYESQLQAWEVGGKDGLENVLKEWEEGSEIDSDQLERDEEGQDDDDDGEGERAVWCEACGKGYRSGGAWEDHERSRKHVKNVERLVKEMRDEDEKLGLGATQPSPSLPLGNGVSPSLSAQDDIDLATLDIGDEEEEEEEEEQGGKRKKDKKKNKKSKKVLSSLPVSDEEELEDEVDALGGELGEDGVADDGLGGTTTGSKKNRKGGGAKGKKGKKALPPTGLDEDEPEETTVPKILDSDDDDERAGGGGKRGKKGKRRANKSGTATPSTLPETESQTDSVQGRDQEGTLESEMSKKDKRRAKEAAKKAKASGTEVSCNVCEKVFASRSKLFSHINDTGHALADGYSPSDVGSGGGKKKKGKR
ncbi:hypothetical protein JCM16303_006762 [Sporobolomyces ruberrimus]